MFGRHHDLVRRFASAAATAHAVGQYGQDAAIDAGVIEQRNLILLVITVALVDAGGSGESVALDHMYQFRRRNLVGWGAKAVLSSQRLLSTSLPHSLDSNLHSPARRLIELRIEHADLDALIDRTVHQFPLDELMMRRLKKRRLGLRDEIARIERELDPDQSA